jgi:pseudouridine-5'-phosphate glycosidase
MIVAVPNPSPSDDIEEAIQKSLASAAADNVTGSKVTPYVLAMVKELTG